ncbi:MAG: type II toxin-antitoxin system HicA family toxin [Planctomycetota bacterium]
MKRTKFLRHLRQNGCRPLREGGRHSVWHNAETGEQEAIPRHTEVSAKLIRSICKHLSINPPSEK